MNNSRAPPLQRSTSHSPILKNTSYLANTESVQEGTVRSRPDPQQRVQAHMAQERPEKHSLPLTGTCDFTVKTSGLKGLLRDNAGNEVKTVGPGKNTQTHKDKTRKPTNPTPHLLIRTLPYPLQQQFQIGSGKYPFSAHQYIPNNLLPPHHAPPLSSQASYMYHTDLHIINGSMPPNQKLRPILYQPSYNPVTTSTLGSPLTMNATTFTPQPVCNSMGVQESFTAEPTPSSPAKNNMVCRYYTSTGDCFYGDHCNFLHVDAPATPTKSPTMHPSASMQNMGTKNSRLCRNIQLQGYCKYQGKGCEYSHNTLAREDIHTGQSNPSIGCMSLPDNGPVSTTPETLPARAWAVTPYSHPTPPLREVPYGPYNSEHMFYPGDTSLPMQLPTPHAPVPTSLTNTTANESVAVNLVQQITNDTARLALGEEGPQTESIGGTVYFYQNPTHSNPPKTHIPRLTPTRTPIVTHKYVGTLSPAPSGVLPVRVAHNPSASFFMVDDLRADLAHRTTCKLQQIDPNRCGKGQVLAVDNYHTLFPLERRGQSNHKLFGVTTSCMKATGTFDGKVYCLRRIEGYNLTNEKALAMVERWKAIDHPGIVGVKEAFTTRDYRDHSLVFVYNYHPGAETIKDCYLQKTNQEPLLEPVIWSFIIQLTSAIRMVHANHLAVRVIDASKILVTSKRRLRISSVGVFDVLTYDTAATQNHLSQQQQEDLTALGRLILALSCSSIACSARDNWNQSLEHISMHYSQELKNLIVYLLYGQPPHGRPKSVDDVILMIGDRFYDELECAHLYIDGLEVELAKELENGRLFRLLCKMGFINERPEYAMDPAWSESGEYYRLKLLRDYLFHQVHDDGTPNLSFSRVVHCLHKLDIGSSERICLVSRDEQSVLLASYKDLKRCVEIAFTDLASMADTM